MTNENGGVKLGRIFVWGHLTIEQVKTMRKRAFIRVKNEKGEKGGDVVLCGVVL